MKKEAIKKEIEDLSPKEIENFLITRKDDPRFDIETRGEMYKILGEQYIKEGEDLQKQNYEEFQRKEINRSYNPKSKLEHAIGFGCFFASIMLATIGLSTPITGNIIKTVAENTNYLLLIGAILFITSIFLLKKR